MSKVKKIGFDLDGVIIDKPPLIPKRILEWLYRGRINKKLSFRYPNSKVERYIRWLSHHPLIRPSIKDQVNIIRKLCKNDRCKLYIVSSRYSFLEDRTKQWLKRHKLENVFEEVFLNLKDDQPHKFKERMIMKLNLDLFIDDDLLLIKYLRKKVDNTEILFFGKQKKYLDKLIK